MRSWFLLLAASLLAAQTGGRSRMRAKVTLTPSAPVGAASFSVAQTPVEGDHFVAHVPTAAIRAALIMPDGTRITRGSQINQERPLFSWYEDPGDPAIGSTDGGYRLIISFWRPGARGAYRLEFTHSRPRRPTDVHVLYEALQDVQERLWRSMENDHPGIKRIGPRTLTDAQPEATIELRLDANSRLALLNVVTSSPSVQVSVVTPDGTLLHPRGTSARHQWSVYPNREAMRGKPTDWIRMAALALPVEGTHHMVVMTNAPPGNYRVTARKLQPGPSAKFEAALRPDLD